MALPKLPPRREEPENEDQELGGSMTFIEHLEELRGRLIKSLLALAIATIFCFCFSATLMELMMKPYDWGMGKTEQPILNLKKVLAPTINKITQAVSDYLENEKEPSTAKDEPNTFQPQPESETSVPGTPPNPGDSLAQLGSVLASHSMLEVFMVRIKLSIVGGIFIVFPILFYQAWRFVAPGLYKREKKFIFPTVISAWICFIVGGMFAYFLVLPTAVYFFSSFSGPSIVNVWSVEKYFNNALHITLAFGVVFEEPVVIGLLAVVGLVRYKHLKKWRPYIIVGMFVVGAVLTPPDPISQLMCAGPLIVLYEGSALFVRAYERARRLKEDNEEEKSESEDPNS